MPQLRLCSWNIHLGQRLDFVLETVGRHRDFGGLDVLALQEASEHAGGQDSAAIAGALGTGFCHAQLTAQTRGGQPQANALVWNSKTLHCSEVDRLDLPSIDAVGGFEGRLLAQLPPQARGGVLLEATLGTIGVRVYSVHVDVVGFAHRRAQVRALLADNRTRRTVGMSIVAGDFNTFGWAGWPSWRAVHADAEQEGLVDLTRSVRWTHAWGPLPIRQKLDLVFASHRPELAYRAWTVPTPASDHLPLFVDLSWP